MARNLRHFGLVVLKNVVRTTWEAGLDLKYLGQYFTILWRGKGHLHRWRGNVGVTFVDCRAEGRLVGRVIDEALPGGAVPVSVRETLTSEASPQGLQTVLEIQRVGDTAYFDAAGFPGRSVGLSPLPARRAAGESMANAPPGR